MEVLGVIGFSFALPGFIFGLSAIAGFRKLTQELETLRRKVQALEDGGKEA